MYERHQPSPRKVCPTAPRCRLPEVADGPAPLDAEPAETAGSDTADTDLLAFKVFMKRNLRNQAPPTDLLAGIRARVAAARPDAAR